MSGQDYIGSKISLISLSDIRYVGILHSINTNDSTVSLENVRSFGTEGRRGNPEDEVVASDTIFDFVVFRGSDIKDLQVFEAPVKPAAPPPPPSISRSPGMVDPSLRPSMEGYPPPPPPMNPYMMPPYPPQAHQAMYWQAPMYPGQPPQQPPPPMQHSVTSSQQQQQQQQHHQMPSAASLPPQSTPVQTPAPALDITPNEKPSVRQQAINEEQQHQQREQQEIDGAAVESLAKQVSELDVDTKETEEPVLPSTATPQRQQQQQQQTNSRNTRQNNNNNQRNQNGKQRITIPQTDFDFESSNAKFSKNELLRELMKGSDEEETGPIEQPHHQQEEQVIIPPPNDEDFYNRSKSFFDNISCESKERQAQEGMVDRRGKFHEERKLNVETFGQASVDQSRFRNFRGRGRGRGGYYRGNRNRNNNNSYGGYRSQQVEPQQQ